MSKNYIILVVVVTIIVVVGGWWYVSSSQRPASIASMKQNNTINNNQNTALGTLTQTDGLAGTWVSAVSGKGIQASGKLVSSKAVTQVTVTGDVQVIIQKVTADTALGTIAYSNLCYDETASVAGGATISKKPQCISVSAKQIELKISGDKISFEGPTATGGTDSFVGTYAGGKVPELSLERVRMAILVERLI